MNVGHCLWFTGLSSCGKSALTQAVSQELDLHGITNCVIDGDELQHILWPELIGGNAREDRRKKSVRVAFAASMVVRCGAIALCSIISPYRTDRAQAREIIERHGEFHEIFVNTPLELCEQRDTRDYYRRARAGLIPNFTGISDVYEAPADPDLELRSTAETTVEDLTSTVIRFICERIVVNEKLRRRHRRRKKTSAHSQNARRSESGSAQPTRDR
jgi:adenylyl-sulfate kinase